jgi:PAS domain S-box-containing protein
MDLQKKDRTKDQSIETSEDSSRSYIRSLELLLNISNSFAQSLDINELFEKIADGIFMLMKRIDRCAILLLGKETKKLREMISRVRPEREDDISAAIHYSRTVVRKAIREGKPVAISNTSYLDKIEFSDSIERMNIRSVMCVPLVYKGEVKGVVYVDIIGFPGGFSKDDVKILTALGNTAAIAFENAYLYEEVRKELKERRHAERGLQQACKDLEREIEKQTSQLSKTIEFLKQEISDHMKAEEAFRESEEKYRSLFQESRDAIFITTHDGSLIEVNNSYLDLLGYIRKEIRNLKVQDTYADVHNRSAFKDEIEQKGSVRNYKVRLRRKDGREIDCLITATVRKTDEGRILGYQGIIREITEYDQAWVSPSNL